MMYFCICTDYGRNIIGEIKTEKEMTTQNIIKQCNLGTKAIWLRTENFAYPLKQSDKPFVDRPELILKARPGYWDSPQTTLFVFSEYDENSIILFLSPKHNTEQNIPRLTVLIPQAELNSNLKKLYELIEASFSKPVNVESIVINDQKMNDNMSIKEIYEKAKIGNEVIVFLNISAKCSSSMDKRKKYIDDIIGSENRYVNDLTALDQDWKENIRSYAFFSETDFNILFKDIAMILAFHKQLLSLLQSKNTGYASEFGRIFLEQAPFFKVSSNYIANYPNINDILKRIKGNADFQKFCDLFSEKFGGLDLPSFLITPIQRIARYHLLLRDLQSETPINHPDYMYIKAAYSAMRNISEEINNKTGFVESQKILVDVQMRNSADFEYVKSDRIVLKQFDTIIKCRNLTGSFIVCNDYVFLIDSLDIYCRFRCPSNAVPIVPLEDGQTVKIISPDFDDSYENGNEITFSSKDDFNEFMNLIKTAEVSQ